MKRILVIEDETAINELICMNLEIAGYKPVPFFDGAKFSTHLKQEDAYDLVLLDIMLPGKDGFELLEELKEHRIPVIYLTAKGDLQSKVAGLRSGAEDYLVKPFEMLELLVRIDKVLSRFQEAEEEIHIRNVTINEKKHTVYKDGKEVCLRPMEFACLLAFLEIQKSCHDQRTDASDPLGCGFRRRDQNGRCTCWKSSEETGFFGGDYHHTKSRIPDGSGITKRGEQKNGYDKKLH